MNRYSRSKDATFVLPKIPEKILRLAEEVRRRGGRALLVGGCVRDALMEREPKDWDVEVYGIEGALLRRILKTSGE
ncbi:MAG: hypothetical protein WKF30_19910 [Pyrinomonadaceae bacterium]